MEAPGAVLVTGASRGLGRELALAWLGEGRRVLGLVRRVDEAMAALARDEPGISWIVADAADETSLGRAATEARASIDRIGLLVNNAAINLELARPDLLEADIAAVAETLRVNAAGPLAVVKAFLPLLGRGSRIVNISSEAGSIALSGRESEFGYCMSKAALNMLSKLLRNRLAAEGIGVFAVHPGWFSSDMGGAAAPVAPRQRARELLRRIEDLGEGSALFSDWTGKELPF